MAWPVQLRAASFRGVPFDVPVRERTGGRRGPTHEYPQRDVPDGEDLGRRLRTFRVEGRIFGDDYIATLARMVDALEAPGPGLYVDPWQGSWTVTARRYSVKESTAEGGLARLTIDFEESGEQRFPQAGLDTVSGVVSAADAVIAASRVSFGERFTVAHLPQFVAAAAEALGGDLSRSVASAVASLGQRVGLPGEAVPNGARALAAFRAALPSLVRADYAGGITGLLGDVSRSAWSDGSLAGDTGNPASALRVMAGLAGFGGDLAPVEATTATRAVQAANQSALIALVRRGAVAEAARATSAVTFDSVDQAVQLRGVLVPALDGVIAEAAADLDDGATEPLRALRAASVADIAARSGGLPRIRRVSVPAATPAVVLAHKMMGDARRVDDLLARNPHVTHPGFVPPGRPLEVLNVASPSDSLPWRRG